MKHTKLNWTWLVLTVLGLFDRCPGCEVVRIPMCKRMPYNMTRMPNLLHHSTQENAILAIEQFEELVDQNCSDVLLFFLCAMYAPICTYEFHSDAIPPCKGVCEQARAGCEPIVNKYNVSWPEGLDCTDLPLYDRGVCVSPEAIVSTLPEDKGRYGGGDGKRTGVSGQTTNQKDCVCKKADNPTRNIYRKRGFQFALHGKPIHSLRTGGSSVTRVQTVSVLVSNKIPVQPGTTVEVWTNSTCVCPEMTPNKEYLILGFEDQQNGKLLFLENSIAVPWRKKWTKRVKNWAKRGKKRRRARNGRRSGKKSSRKSRKTDTNGRKSRRKDRNTDGKTVGSSEKKRTRKNRRTSGKSARRKEGQGAANVDDSRKTTPTSGPGS